MKLEGLNDPTGNTPDEECFALMEEETDSIKPTLRDQFAMAALSGEIARSAGFYPKPENVAPYCYELADAMLKARHTKEQDNERD